MTGETLAKESAAVQIGHPITERRFTTAIPYLRDQECIRSITDLGAGGLSCGAGEMGAETGVELDLDAVPLKDHSLTAWEILLSESQERMLLAIPPEKTGGGEIDPNPIRGGLFRHRTLYECRAAGGDIGGAGKLLI